MICSALTTLTSSDARGVRGVHVNSFDQRALHHGATMNELKCISDLSPFELDLMHIGKDRSIEHMLGGGNGYPLHSFNPMATALFDSGCTIERRDMRAVLAWQNSLQQCKHDRARGATA